MLFLVIASDDPNRVRPRDSTKLDTEAAKAARGAPDKDIVCRLHDVRAVAEQHAVGCGKRQCVAGALFPGQMLGARHALARLYAAELGEGAVWSFVAPDTLTGREHRVAAITFLVVAIILVAVDDHFVTRLHACHFATDSPYDPGRVGPCNMEILLVNVEHGHRLAKCGPDAIIVHASCHHEDQHFVGIDFRNRNLFQLHRR